MKEIDDGVTQDEWRCIRDSGSGWRCNDRRFQDKKLCEKHYNQKHNKSGTKKRNRSLGMTVKAEETNEDQPQIEEEHIDNGADKQIKRPKTRAGEEVGDGVPPSTPPAEGKPPSPPVNGVPPSTPITEAVPPSTLPADGVPPSTPPPDGVPPSIPPPDGVQPVEMCCLRVSGKGRQCNGLRFQGNKLCKKHYNESQQRSKKKDTERKRSRGKSKTETKEDQVQIEEEHMANGIDKLKIHQDWVGGRCIRPQDKHIKQPKTRAGEEVGDGVPLSTPPAEGKPSSPPVNGVPPSTPTTEAVPPSPPVNGVPPSTTTTEAVPSSMPPANGVPHSTPPPDGVPPSTPPADGVSPSTPPADGVQPDELCCLPDSGRGRQCNGLRFQGNKLCKKHYNESQQRSKKKDTERKKSQGKSKTETKEDQVQIDEEHIVNGVDKLIVHQDWVGGSCVSPQDKIEQKGGLGKETITTLETGGQSKEIVLEASAEGVSPDNRPAPQSNMAILPRYTQVSLFDEVTLENEMHAHVESMKIFHSMPQHPHFLPLQERNEELRQGLALGYMVSFANMVKKIGAAQLDEPKSVLENKLNALIELEAVGFNVQVVRARLEELLRFKDSHVRFDEELKEVEGKITNETHKEGSLKLEVAEVDEKLRELEERRKKLVMEMQTTGSSIAALEERRHEIAGKLQGANVEFTRVAAAPW